MRSEALALGVSSQFKNDDHDDEAADCLVADSYSHHVLMLSLQFNQMNSPWETWTACLTPLLTFEPKVNGRRAT